MLKFSPFEWAVIALAAFRITSLIVDDTILDRPRDWVLARVGPKFKEGLTCSWCVGWWTAAAIVMAVWTWPWLLPFYAFLAVAAVIGLLASWAE